MKIATSIDLPALIKAVAVRKDRQSFVSLFDYYAPRLNSYLQKKGIKPDVAEEIIQDVMVTIWKKAELFDPLKSSVSTWIYRITRNRSIDIMRQNKFEFLDFDISEMDVGQEIDEGEYELIEKEKNIRQALQQLPSEQLELVRFAFFDGLSHVEIAAKTGLPLGTVKSRIRLGFARLKKEVLERSGMESWQEKA